MAGGGYRAQAGRVPKAKSESTPLCLQGPFPDAMTFLMALINSDADLDMKLRAAISLLPFQEVRVADRGKKDLKRERAADLVAEGGPFAPSAPPKPN